MNTKLISFLGILFFILISSVTKVSAVEDASLFDLSGTLPEMSPELSRRQVDIPNIDALDVEVGVFFGMLNVEDFGANYYYGISGFFHITEDFFINANFGRSEITDETFRRMNLPLFGVSGKRSISDYNFLVGWNFLSGEMFWSQNYAFTSDVYLVAGAGSIDFDNESYFNIVGGIGVKILFTDWLALRFEAKVSEYDSSFLGYDKTSHNVDVISGLTVFY